MSISAFFDKSVPPSPEDITNVLGPKSEIWDKIVTHIGDTYNLNSEPKYYGKSAGWVIWFRKS